MSQENNRSKEFLQEESKEEEFPQDNYVDEEDEFTERYVDRRVAQEAIAGKKLIQIGGDYLQFIKINVLSGHWGLVAIALIPLLLFLFGVKAGTDKVVKIFEAKPSTANLVDAPKPIASPQTLPSPGGKVAVTSPLNSNATEGKAKTQADAKRLAAEREEAKTQADAKRLAAEQEEAKTQADAKRLAAEREEAKTQADAKRLAAEQEEARKWADEEARRRDSICILTITSPLVSLKSKPESFSQELIRVHPGEYIPINYNTVTNSNGRREGWFFIEAGGRRGWISDDTWMINSKTRLCQ
jgi:hypothetical protein